MLADGASLSEILNELCSVIDAYASATSQVLLMDPTGHQLLPLAGPNFPPAVTAAFAPWPVGPNRGCCGTAAFLGKRVIVSDMSTDPRWPQDEQGEVARRFVMDHGLHAAWSEPLISNAGEVLGTFCIGYSQPRTPTSQDLQLIESAGHIARIAIERHQSQKALTAALAAIKDSETNLRRVIDTIPTLAWCNSPEGPNEFLNKRWHEYTGRSHEESTGWGWQAAFHPEDVPPMMKKWQELLASGESGEIEARLRRHDGVYRWFLIRVEPFRDERGRLVAEDLRHDSILGVDLGRLVRGIVEDQSVADVVASNVVGDRIADASNHEAAGVADIAGGTLVAVGSIATDGAIVASDQNTGLQVVVGRIVEDGRRVTRNANACGPVAIGSVAADGAAPHGNANSGSGVAVGGVVEERNAFRGNREACVSVGIRDVAGERAILHGHLKSIIGVVPGDIVSEHQRTSGGHQEPAAGAVVGRVIADRCRPDGHRESEIAGSVGRVAADRRAIPSRDRKSNLGGSVGCVPGDRCARVGGDHRRHPGRTLGAA